LAPANAPSTRAPVEEYAVKPYARSHVSDDALHHSAIAHAASERGATADLLADLAEIDVRRFYLAMAYPSLFAYCVAELRLSDDAAYNRIKAARAARRFPVIFEAVADGRLSLTAVLLLVPHLTETAAPELLVAAMGKTKSEVEKLLAECFPRADVPACVVSILSHASPPSIGDARQGSEPCISGAVPTPGPQELSFNQLVPEPVDSGVRSKVKPLAPERYEIHFSMSQSAHDKLRYLQDLLGFDMPSGDLGQLFEDALEARIREVERRKFAATDQPRRPGRTSRDPRHIPADVKRAVWRRDGARCTFVSDDGRRCEARKGLEFDHVHAVARGGEASASNIRLLCPAHNQFAAAQTFGAEFVRHKRSAAAEAKVAASGVVTAPDARHATG
jgi:5-methylcytosine-specific restriction endonuclease McrA